MTSAVGNGPIRTAQEYKTALAAIGQLWDSAEGTPERDAFEALVNRVQAYESEHFGG